MRQDSRPSDVQAQLPHSIQYTDYVSAAADLPPLLDKDFKVEVSRADFHGQSTVVEVSRQNAQHQNRAIKQASSGVARRLPAA
jgi:hypothetical protein